MPDSWNRGRGGRRPGDRTDGPPSPGYPAEFSGMDDGLENDRVDPADLLAIRADDELLDALAAGHPLGGYFPPEPQNHYADDQAVMALLGTWKRDVEVDTFPELCTVEEAAAAIAAGQRASRPRRRLFPVATAAAVAVLALAGVGVAAGNATPGSPLWGLSTMLNGQRAQSIQAAQNVSVALASAQKALSEGRVTEARQTLAKVAPELGQINDPERKRQLSLKSQNLQDTVEASHDGETVDTDSRGVPTNPDHPALHRIRERDESSSQESSSSSPSSSGSDSSSSDSSGSSSSPSPDSSGSTSPSDDPRMLRNRDSTSSRPSGGTSHPSPSYPNFPGMPSSWPSGMPRPGQFPFPGMPGNGQPGGSVDAKPGTPTSHPHTPSPRPAPTTSNPPAQGGGQGDGGQGGGGTGGQPGTRPSEPSSTHRPPTTTAHPRPTQGNDSSGDTTSDSSSGDQSGNRGQKHEQGSNGDGAKSQGGSEHQSGGDRGQGGSHRGSGRAEGGPDPATPAGMQPGGAATPNDPAQPRPVS